MTPDEFRRFALRFKDAFEHAHFGHPDFRVGSRIFATLGYPDIDFGMVKLTPEQQQLFMAAAPDVFSPSKGAWGAGGSTLVRLVSVAPALLQDALTAAWHDAVTKASKRSPKTASPAKPADAILDRKRPASKRAAKKVARVARKKVASKSVAKSARTTKRPAKKSVRKGATPAPKKNARSKNATKRAVKRAASRRPAGSKR